MPGFDRTGPPDGGPGWGRGSCGMRLARGRMRGMRRCAGRQGMGPDHPFRGRRGSFWRDFPAQSQGMAFSPSEETEQLKRDLAAAKEEVAELENRLREFENEKI